MKFTPFFVLFLGVSAHRSYNDDVEGSETTVPVGLGSNFIDHYGGSSFIGRNGPNGFGGYEEGLGYHQGLGGYSGRGDFNHLGHGNQGRYIRNGFGGSLGHFGGGSIHGGNFESGSIHSGGSLGAGGIHGGGLGAGGIHGGGLGVGGIHGGSLGAGRIHGAGLGVSGIHGGGLGVGGIHGGGLGVGGIHGGGLVSGGIHGGGLASSGIHGEGLASSGIHGGNYISHHPHGGEVIDQTSFNSGKKNLEDGSFEKSSGNRIAELSQGENGFSQGKVGQQSSKGDLGYFNDQQAAKKLQEDGKVYIGGQQFNQQGQNANENKQQLGHKKGHVVKGFKSSHHKDETGKTEEFYDEAHDEGDNFNFRGQNGKFGEGSQLSFKGGHDDSFYNADERKKQGHYDGQQYINKNNADQGQYGQNKYLGNGQIYGVNNGVDQQALLGHQEHSRLFKSHPYYSHFY